MKRNKISISVMIMLLIAGVFCSCKDDKSYTDLLNEEERAVNWYLSGCNIVPYVPADSVFETGENAPYYKMDEDGNVYMQVVNRGNMKSRPEKGNTIYFRVKLKNIKEMWEGLDPAWVGNGLNLSLETSSLIYGNLTLTSSAKWGEGIQVPLEYLGYDCEVNLVVKSRKGYTEYASQCIPLLMNVKYFKAEY